MITCLCGRWYHSYSVAPAPTAVSFRGLYTNACLFIFRSSATAMEIVTHLINDTIEFYKWTLTIAGNISSVFVCFCHVWESFLRELCFTSDWIHIVLCVHLYTLHIRIHACFSCHKTVTHVRNLLFKFTYTLNLSLAPLNSGVSTKLTSRQITYRHLYSSTALTCPLL